jgi:hypothetical protein
MRAKQALTYIDRWMSILTEKLMLRRCLRKVCLTAFVLPPTKSFCPYKLIPASESGETNLTACASGKRSERICELVRKKNQPSSNRPINLRIEFEFFFGVMRILFTVCTNLIYYI